jgi:hypothetical protein
MCESNFSSFSASTIVTWGGLWKGYTRPWIEELLEGTPVKLVHNIPEEGDCTKIGWTVRGKNSALTCFGALDMEQRKCLQWNQCLCAENTYQHCDNAQALSLPNETGVRRIFTIKPPPLDRRGFLLFEILGWHQVGSDDDQRWLFPLELLIDADESYLWRKYINSFSPEDPGSCNSGLKIESRQRGDWSS